MPANTLVQTRINFAIKIKATAVLEKMGMTVSNAVRYLLTRTANEGALSFSVAAGGVQHDEWFSAKVREALEDTRSLVVADQVKAHFAGRRAAAHKKVMSELMRIG